MKPSANMEKIVIDEDGPIGRSVYITRYQGNALVMLTILNGNGDFGVIHDLIVHKDWRNAGIGEQLLNAACEEAEKLGLSRVRIAVEPQTWMEEWYERKGFMFTGFSTINGTLCSIMEKDLTRRESAEPQMS